MTPGIDWKWNIGYGLGWAVGAITHGGQWPDVLGTAALILVSLSAFDMFVRWLRARRAA